jgi:hypothetical protein
MKSFCTSTMISASLGRIPIASSIHAFETPRAYTSGIHSKDQVKQQVIRLEGNEKRI